MMTSRKRGTALMPALLIVLVLMLVSAEAADALDLRADANRDGLVDVTGSTDEDAEAGGRSAIFLANVDDDQRRCKSVDGRGRPLKDFELDDCHDGTDRRVNGPHDLLDLARVRLMPEPDVAVAATVDVDPAKRRSVRLFVKRGRRFVSFDGRLTAAEVAAGVELAVEGTDVVRDPRQWDGSVTLSVTAKGASDEVALQVAPLLTQPDTLAARRIFAAPTVRFRADGRRFTRDLDRARVKAGISTSIDSGAVTDPFIQDVFKPTTAAMPAPEGGQHVMRVLLRSANVEDPTKGVLRVNGRFLFTHLRGRDVGAVQQVDLRWARKHVRDQTLNSAGNFGTIPPHPDFPVGRIIAGSAPGHRPDPSFMRLLQAQALQRPLTIDTSWLTVGHVDEIVGFVPSATPRGWSLIAADPRIGLQLLRDAQAAGHGRTKVLAGKRRDADRAVKTRIGFEVKRVSAARTIDQALADRRLVEATERAAVRIDAQVERLRQATGLAERDVVRLAALFDESTFIRQGAKPPKVGPTLEHFIPAMVNGQSLGTDLYAAPDPHGPRVSGVDLFRRQAQDALAAVGVRVSWVETWYFHEGDGELHCATNILRAPDPSWWRLGPWTDRAGSWTWSSNGRSRAHDG